MRKNLVFKYDGENKKTIYDLLTQNNSDRLNLDFPCGGKKTCRKCKVKITEGFEFLSEPDDAERKFLTDAEIRENIRYACMCEVSGDITIELNPDIMTDNKIQIQTQGLISKNISPDKFKKFANGKNINIYGAAVDIGTTTVAVYLYDMITGICMGIATEENPQRAYGADVISRISYTIENPDGLDNLKTLILSLVFGLIKNLCEENNINQNDVYHIVLTGNTVMQHIAFGYPPKTIAFAPFTPVSLFGFDVTLGELLQTPVGVADTPFQKGAWGTGINPDAIIYFPPAFASYVGGDIATGIIASDTDLCDNLRLFLDIGTNGEIGLIDRTARSEPLPYEFLFCATAAGPAFEGAHIKLGMAGIKGAINNIYLDESDNIICETIGDIAPKGLCGSGIIDAVALMLELGVLEDTGRILDSDEIEEIDEIPEKYKKFADNLCETDGENVFVLDSEHNIYITQKDIREIQLAKASVCAGIMTLLNYCGKTLGEVSEVILAGGFGAHINKKSACKIGLIPGELEDKIINAGNTAGTGAVSVLLDTSACERINKIPAISKYIELSGDAFFMDEYIDRMMF